jgi:hypothetical protein
MNTHAGRRSIGTCRGRASRYLSRCAVCILLSGLTAVMLSAVAQADNFANVYYSARKDQLVITMGYRGTNPNHSFSLKWGQCQDLDGGGREISAEVLDSQWQDVEQSDFKKTTRFSLAEVSCRPAKLTLRSAPRFFYTLQIPSRPRANP